MCSIMVSTSLDCDKSYMLGISFIILFINITSIRNMLVYKCCEKFII